MSARAARALILLILAAVCPASTWAAEPAAEKDARKPVFETSLAAAMEAAAKDGALVLVVFMSGFSEACDALEEQTLFSARFQEQGGALHVVSINVDLEEAVARRFHVGPVPDLVLVTAEENIVARAQRFMTPAELVRWLDDGRTRAADGAWEGIAAGAPADDVPDGTDPETVARAAEMLGTRDAADRARVIGVLAARRDGAMPVVLAGLAHD